MSDKIQDLLRQAREKESRLAEATAVMGLHQADLDDIKRAVIKERWGVVVGTRVIYRGDQYDIAQIQIQGRSAENLSERKPWAMGNRIKKDGKPSDQAFHIYDEWTLAEAKEV